MIYYYAIWGQDIKLLTLHGMIKIFNFHINI
jgi:hypothetical protein